MQELPKKLEEFRQPMGADGVPLIVVDIDQIDDHPGERLNVGHGVQVGVFKRDSEAPD